MGQLVCQLCGVPGKATDGCNVCDDCVAAAKTAAAREANGCPCCYGSPCSEQCTCARPMMSGGCGRCARYGSEEQQRDAARVLIEREQQAVAREAELVAALRAAHPMVLAAASPDFVAEYERILASPSVAGEAYARRLEAAEAQRADRPRIICLCGSTRFIDVMAVTGWEEEKRGKIVLGCHLLPAWYTGAEGHLAEEQGVAAVFDALHLHKIEMADEVLVIDVGGYIGKSTTNEIAHAERLGKPIRYWSQELALRASEAGDEPSGSDHA